MANWCSNYMTIYVDRDDNGTDKLRNLLHRLSSSNRTDKAFRLRGDRLFYTGVLNDNQDSFEVSFETKWNTLELGSVMSLFRRVPCIHSVHLDFIEVGSRYGGKFEYTRCGSSVKLTEYKVSDIYWNFSEIRWEGPFQTVEECMEGCGLSEKEVSDVLSHLRVNIDEISDSMEAWDFTDYFELSDDSSIKI